VWKRVKKNWRLYLFVLPVIVYLAVFNYAPIYGVLLAFKDFNPVQGIWGSKFNGFEHFTRFFNSFYFGRLIKNTLLLNIMNLVIGFPVPILLALVINEVVNRKAKKTIQTVIFAPYFISTVVVIGMLSVFLNTSTGLVNVIIKDMGGAPISFLTDASKFRWLYVISDIWQFSGYNSVIYLAALSTIDPQLHDAAKIDGASRLKRIIHINLPALMPTITVLFILQVGRLMTVGFEKAFLLQNMRNLETSEVISTYVYKMGLLNSDYGFSTAVGLFNNVINFILLLTFNALSKRVGDSKLY